MPLTVHCASHCALCLSLCMPLTTDARIQIRCIPMNLHPHCHWHHSSNLTGHMLKVSRKQRGSAAKMNLQSLERCGQKRLNDHRFWSKNLHLHLKRKIDTLEVNNYTMC